jgi:hypothetical protein
VVPPLFDPSAHHAAPPAKIAHHHRHLTEDLETSSPSYETGSTSETNEAQIEPEPQPEETAPAAAEEHHQEPDRPKPDREEAPVNEAIAETPPSETGATEFVESQPAPPPSETTSSVSSSSSGGGGSTGSSSSGTAAGEFGP